MREMNKNIDAEESLYEKLVRCSQLGEVPERLRFDAKPLLWESQGVVFQENYAGSTGKNVLLKVQYLLRDLPAESITGTTSRDGVRGIVPIEEYQLFPYEVVCNGQRFALSDKKEQFRVANAFREVNILDYLARAGLGERFVQRRYCPDIGRDHELFFTGNDLCLRTLMEMKPGVCLGDRDVRYATEREKKFEIMHPRDIVRYAADLAEDLLVLRAHNIFHNDVKRANVLREVGEPGYSRFHLVDFGSARFSYEHVDRHLVVGTDGYQAPEVMKAYGPNSFSDAWSLGALLYAEIVGQVPVTQSYKEITNEMMDWARDRLYRAKAPFQFDFLDAVLLLLSDAGSKRDLAGLRDISLRLLEQGNIYRSSLVDETTQRLQAVRVGCEVKEKEVRDEFKRTASLPTTDMKVARVQRSVTDTFREGEIDVTAIRAAFGIEE